MAEQRKLTLGILAHVDAGKTTLSEAMLYKTGELRKLGRVDHRDAFLDNNQIERNRGITVFSKQARLTIDGAEFTLIDTPGHVDFATEMERSLSIIDYALLVVSGSEGVQAHTRTLYRMLTDRSIPVFVFVNKMDIAVRGKDDIIEDMRSELSPDGPDTAGFVDFTGAGGRTEKFIDDVTLFSPELADAALEFELGDEDEFSAKYGDADTRRNSPFSDKMIADAVRNRQIVPCVFGSALKLEGVDELLEVLGRYTEEPYYPPELAAKVYKITNNEDGERLCFVKVTGGELKVRDKISGISRTGKKWEAKINQIRLYSGSKFVTAETAKAGTVCGITGLADAQAGDGIGAEPPGNEQTIIPYMSYSVSGPKGMDPYLVMQDMMALAEEDPALGVTWQQETGGIEIRLMGQVQLEVVAGLVKQRFGYDIYFDSGKILYLETIAGTYEGVGHFEPLRHYAEVHLIIEPGEPGSGIVITSITPEDELARNWQRLILTHIEEKEHTGVLAGAPLTDVKIILAAGRAHDKHTSGGDFREATYRAIRNALMQARRDDKAVLLEPWYDYEIELPSQHVGRAMTDIRQMSGTQEDLEQNGDVSRIRGRVPASEIAGYSQILTGYTAGAGKISYSPSGYAPCHDTEKVIEETGYDPERDIDNPADSVFVSHGGSDIVKWYDVPEAMHIGSVLERLERIRNSADHGGLFADQARGPGGVLANGSPFGAGGSGIDVREEEKRRRAAEAELRMIFEKTYGPGRSKIHNEARSRSFRKGREVGPRRERDFGNESADPETRARQERNQEIKARHEKKTQQVEEKTPLILVDGYNIIHSDLYLKDLASRDMGAARDQLLDRLSNYAAYIGYDMTVVFDAYLVPYGLGSEEDIYGIKVVYTHEEEPADIYMGKVTAQVNDRQVYVVSSDSLVQQDAWGHGALRISSKDFLNTLTQAEKEIREKLAHQ